MQTVEKQMLNDNMKRIQATAFMFSDGSSDIKLNIDTSNAQGWQLALKSPNIVSLSRTVFFSPLALCQQAIASQQNFKASYPNV